MSRISAIDRLLALSIGLLLVLGGIHLYFSATGLRNREEDLARLALLRSQQMLNVKLDGVFHEWSEDLIEEVAAVTPFDSVPDGKSIERWVPLMRSHWSILSIRLADEQGNETAIYREDTAFILVRTLDGSKTGPPIAMRIAANASLDSIVPDRTANEGYDPRERVWFSKALENDRDVPVWSLRQFGDTASTVLQLSFLLRSEAENLPYRVLMFDVDPSRSEQLFKHGAMLRDMSVRYWTSDGRGLVSDSTVRDPDLLAAEQRVRTDWMANKSRRGFDADIGDRRFRASVESFLLNGLSVHVAVVMDIAPLRSWLDFDRTLIRNSIILVTLLSALLLVIGWRRNRARRNIMKQEKRHDHQARRLEKVMGEREVLSREVHHRVKNNLQVVSSLLNLQAATLADGPVREEFLRGKRRIDVIALVHHKLYGLPDLRNVDLKEFFAQLVDALAELHRPTSRTVSTGIDTGEIHCDQDTAIELGIILCELVANAYQHAFPYATGGHIDISTRNVEGDLFRLMVHNNGVGLVEGYSGGPGKLGLEIVDALSGQLDGSFHARTNGGVTFEVLFRMRQKPSAAAELAANAEPPE